MERSFIATEESEYSKRLNDYGIKAEEQRKFIIKFFEENGIESFKYMVGGSGTVNKPFEEYRKGDITLYIIPTEKDFDSFAKMLTKSDSNGLCAFKKRSAIGKKFAQQCVDEKVVINLSEPDMREFFKSMDWHGYSLQRCEHDNKLYIKINCEFLKEDDTPEGFIEIKLSEFHKAMEEYELEESK